MLAEEADAANPVACAGCCCRHTRPLNNCNANTYCQQSGKSMQAYLGHLSSDIQPECSFVTLRLTVVNGALYHESTTLLLNRQTLNPCAPSISVQLHFGCKVLKWVGPSTKSPNCIGEMPGNYARVCNGSKASHMVIQRLSFVGLSGSAVLSTS